MLTHGRPACPSRSPSAGRCTCHLTFERLVSGVPPRKPPQACLLLFGPMASCRISIERDILAVLHSRLRSSHCSSVVNGMLISAKNIGDYRVITNYVCHVSLLRFTRECCVLSNFDGQESVARFTGDRPASRKREGAPPYERAIDELRVRCSSNKVYLGHRVQFEENFLGEPNARYGLKSWLFARCPFLFF